MNDQNQLYRTWRREYGWSHLPKTKETEARTAACRKPIVWSATKTENQDKKCRTNKKMWYVSQAGVSHVHTTAARLQPLSERSIDAALHRRQSSSAILDNKRVRHLRKYYRRKQIVFSLLSILWSSFLGREETLSIMNSPWENRTLIFIAAESMLLDFLWGLCTIQSTPIFAYIIRKRWNEITVLAECTYTVP